MQKIRHGLTGAGAGSRSRKVRDRDDFGFQVSRGNGVQSLYLAEDRTQNEKGQILSASS